MVRKTKIKRGGNLNKKNSIKSRKLAKRIRLKKGGTQSFPLEYFRKNNNIKGESKKIVVIGGNKKRRTKGGRKLVKRKI